MSPIGFYVPSCGVWAVIAVGTLVGVSGLQPRQLQWSALPTEHAAESLLPTLLRGLAEAVIGLLVGGAGTLSSCLQLASATDSGTPKGMACSLHTQLIGLATATTGMLMYGVIFPSPQGKSHAGVAPAGATFQVWGCKSHCWGGCLLRWACSVGWVIWCYQGRWKLLKLAPANISYLGWGRTRKMAPASTFVLGEISCISLPL